MKVDPQHCHSDGSIYYFGYGALVNPISRQRRGINTCQAQAASLPDYRLTFAFGGAANIVKKKGWEVHGILMRVSSPKDFEILRDFDTGYDCVQVDVVPYKDYWNECSDDEEEGETLCGYRNSLRGKQPIKANVFVMHQDEDENNELPMDKLPQERYLRVIASGMKSYGVNDDYIAEEIMDTPYIPNRNPMDYMRFPPASKLIPRMNLLEWDIERARMIQRANAANQNLLLLRIGRHVIKVQDDHDPESPFNVWVKGRCGEGKEDATWCVIQTLFDPDLPLINSADEVSILHQEWAENQMVEKFQQAGISATVIVQVLSGMDDSDRTYSITAASCTGSTLGSCCPITEEVDPFGQRKQRKSKSLRSSIYSGFKGVFFKKAQGEASPLDRREQSLQ